MENRTMVTVKFKTVIGKFFQDERSSRSMTMKDFGSLLTVSAATINKREAEGLSDFIVLCETLEKLGYDPVEKLKELRKEALTN